MDLPAAISSNENMIRDISKNSVTSPRQRKPPKTGVSR